MDNWIYIYIIIYTYIIIYIYPVIHTYKHTTHILHINILHTFMTQELLLVFEVETFKAQLTSCMLGDLHGEIMSESKI